jgi:hypothetical protein
MTNQPLVNLAAIIVVLSGTWLVGLAVAAFLRPETVKSFLDKFASSALTHFFEMFLRLVAGASFVIYAPQMKFSFVFTIFGWILILTTAVLMLVPWKVHRRFADRSLPLVTKHMWLFGVASFLGGCFVLSAFFIGHSYTL